MTEDFRNEIIDTPSILDYVDGAESAVVFESRTNDWGQFLPTAENQYRLIKRKTLDVSACATFSVLNSIEAQINYLVKKGDISSDALEQLGLIDGNFRPDFSDRWLAKVSGTTRDGNSSWKVGDTFRTKGCVSENMWSWGDNIKTWEQYYEQVPSQTFDHAKKILDLIDVKQEWLYFPAVGIDGNPDKIIKKHSAHAPIIISAPVCPSWSRHRLSKERNLVASCNIQDAGGTSHASVVFGIDKDGNRLNFDHYEPHVKRLAKDYPITRMWKLVVTAKVAPKVEVPLEYEFYRDMEFGVRGEDVKQLQLRLIREGFLKAGLATGYFGNHTKVAVMAYQKRYADKILVPAGLNAPTGFVGAYTRSHLNGS
jgi:hypothetical protein